MKINYTQELHSVDGRAIVAENEEIWTLKKVCLVALLSFRPLRQGESLSLEEQMKRFKLADKVEKGKDLKSEDIVLIKNVVAHWFQAPALVGAAINALEPEVEDE